MKTFNFNVSGNLDKFMQDTVNKYQGTKADKYSIAALNSDIEFIVCDLRAAHGNLNKYSKEAWLCPANGDGSFNISVSW